MTKDPETRMLQALLAQSF